MKPSDMIINDEIVLEGVIVPSEYEDWYDSGIITANLVRRALAQMGGDVVVRVNSAGGDPTEGEAIRAMFESHAGKVTVKVAGDAMSAASLMIMSADRIEMSAGSIMMIHDPATITFGTAGDHRKSAEVLDILADAYASVYAERSGKSAQDMRALMVEELYMGPEQAIAHGFADAVSNTGSAADGTVAMSAEIIAAAGIRHAGALRMVDDFLTRAFPALSQNTTASGGLNPAIMATNKEAHMPDPVITAAIPPTPIAPVQMVASPPASPPAPAPVDAQAVLMGERTRMKAIRDMGAPFLASGQLTAADVDALIDDGTSAEDAAQRFMTKMAATQPPVVRQTHDPVTITRDETDTRMEGMIGALMGQRDGPAEMFGGLRLKSLAMELAGPNRGYNEGAAVRTGMMSTVMMGGALGVSDFSYITTEVMNRSLIAEYQRRAANWTAVTGTPVSASDFRELSPVRFGGDFQLKTVKENGEYQEATLADEAEGLKVERRGRTINITFEAVINDDMGAFTRIPREFAMAARIMEASMVWSLIRSNATLKSDSTALFHAAKHGNLAASAGAIATATVGAARKAMWEQRAFGTKDSDDFMMVEPDLLIVPPALELVAGQFVATVTPGKDSDANPFKTSVTPVVAAHLGVAAGGSDTAWYMVSSDLPPVTHAYLDGYEAPTVQTIEGMNPDKVTMNARHIFGAAVTEYRGAYKNAGA
jgi:ATP-dependent protease ClpP protease subunit